MAGLVSNVVFVVFCTGGLGLVGVVVLSADFPRYMGAWRWMGGVLTMASRAGSEPRRAHAIRLAHRSSLQDHRQNGTATGSKYFATLRLAAQLAARIRLAQSNCNPMRAYHA